MIDKKLAAEKIRACLERRISLILGCQPHELPHLKIGSLTHFAFLLDGTAQTIGGFETTMRTLLDLLGHETVWEIEPGAEPIEKVVVN
ncbi:MAG TPA: hypothetical protein VIX91_14990 [Candidatus Acidoferrum sp.]